MLRGADRLRRGGGLAVVGQALRGPADRLERPRQGGLLGARGTDPPLSFTLTYTYEPPSWIGYGYVEGDISDAQGEYTFEDRADGTTLATLSMRLDPGGLDSRPGGQGTRGADHEADPRGPEDPRGSGLISPARALALRRRPPPYAESSRSPRSSPTKATIAPRPPPWRNRRRTRCWQPRLACPKPARASSTGLAGLVPAPATIDCSSSASPFDIPTARARGRSARVWMAASSAPNTAIPMSPPSAGWWPGSPTLRPGSQEAPG